ncbi:MAG: asparagine synthase (glutamine-hydrolyzing) [Desulfobacteraceae bacterium]|nr:asparagine synthase (glutamine-hydrolyzing) [Desulfobacteraceae bacterium]
MCGICGIFNFRKTEPIDVDLLKEMNNRMYHRGPDDEGYYISDNVGIAMRRLSIIDIATGRQPIHNENKTVWIVFNGEIYNYREMREFLLKKGHHFNTNSDTETIVHLYEEFGEDCVNYLRGMFAFAIWDSNSKTLIVARDRIGIKPLFYSVIADEHFVFGSEIKALLSYPEINRKMDIQGLDAFFAYTYIPAPLTIYKGIKKLLPGHLMKINSRGISIRQYWDLNFQPDFSKKESYFQEKFEEIFSEAVEMRLLSEVPLGAFLSGGIDSSLVVAYMAASMREMPRTFTIGFSGDVGGFLDERGYAQLVAKKYKCKHHEIEVEPKFDVILDEIITAFDEPFADDSVIPSYRICEASKGVVTVALTGLGGDELFAGYERYLGFRLSLLYDFIPSVISKKFISPVIEGLPEQKNGHYTINHMKRFARSSHLSPALRYNDYVSTLSQTKRCNLFEPSIAHVINFQATTELTSRYYNANGDALSPMDRVFYQDIKTYLPDDILALTDRIGMFHSLELRVPFTDHKLVEFCATIPAGMKLKNLTKKHLLKKIAKGVLPREVISHRKQGFSSPMAKWLQADLKPYIYDLISKEKIEKDGILNWNFIERVLDEHFSRRELHDKLIFAIIMFQKWRERYPVT